MGFQTEHASVLAFRGAGSYGLEFNEGILLFALT